MPEDDVRAQEARRTIVRRVTPAAAEAEPEAMAQEAPTRLAQRALESADRLSPVSVLALQRTAGNRGVLRLLRSKAHVQRAAIDDDLPAEDQPSVMPGSSPSHLPAAASAVQVQRATSSQEQTEEEEKKTEQESHEEKKLGEPTSPQKKQRPMSSLLKQMQQAAQEEKKGEKESYDDKKLGEPSVPEKKKKRKLLHLLWQVKQAEEEKQEKEQEQQQEEKKEED